MINHLQVNDCCIDSSWALYKMLLPQYRWNTWSPPPSSHCQEFSCVNQRLWYKVKIFITISHTPITSSMTWKILNTLVHCIPSKLVGKYTWWESVWWPHLGDSIYRVVGLWKAKVPIHFTLTPIGYGISIFFNLMMTIGYQFHNDITIG